MAGLLEDLTKALAAAQCALRDFEGASSAVDFGVIKHLMDTKPSGAAVRLLVKDPTGHVYGGMVEMLFQETEEFSVLADDGELVRRVWAGQVLSVRLK